MIITVFEFGCAPENEVRNGLHNGCRMYSTVTRYPLRFVGDNHAVATPTVPTRLTIVTMPRQKAGKSPVLDADEREADLETAREALLNAVEGNNGGEEIAALYSTTPVLQLFLSSNTSITLKAGLSSREQTQLLLDSVKTCSKAQARRLFAGLKGIVVKLVQDEMYVPESAYDDGKRSHVDNDNVFPDPESSKALHFLRMATLCLQAYLEVCAEKHDNPKKQLPMIGEALELAQTLHDTLFSLDSCGSDALATQNAIVTLCETWWLRNASQRELLLVQSLPLLVVTALGDATGVAQKSDVKRLFQIRDALQVIDFSDDSSESLRTLLLRMAASPQSLRSPEGRRFLAYLFYIDESLQKDLHRAFRAQIPDARASVIEAYSEIYWRAWKEAPDVVIQESIESNILSDLIYAVLHIANPNMATSLMTLLEPFHDAKKNADVETLLHRMYGPILWRSLSSANALVRVHATTILAEVFPLQEPSHTQTEKAIHKAVACLKTVLQDRDARVRVAASIATTTILSTYWDTIPATEIRSLLNRTYHCTLVAHPAYTI
jgi:condensin-2 complex subunit G2